jgi:hypothetical protein
MGCGPSNSANAAVELFLNNTPDAETSHRPVNPSSEKNYPKVHQPKIPLIVTLRQQSGTTKTIGMNENRKAINYDYDNTVSEERIQYSNGAGPFSTPNGTQYTAQTANLPSPKAISPVEVGIKDPHWQELWFAHKDILLDPADVHATLQDLMANATNRLSDAEILFLQRRVRSIVRQSHLQTGQQSISNGGKNRKKTRHASGSPLGNSTSSFMQELQDTHSIAKNHHLLTAHVLRKVLPEPPVPMVKCNIEFLASNFTQTMGSQSDFGNRIVDLSSSDNNVDGIGSDTISSIEANDSVSTIRTVETTYLLALFCNDVLWDNVAKIAVDSAKANDLEMDVNKIGNESKDNTSKLRNNRSNLPQLPVPSEPTCERTPEMPLGMGLHALTFILGLGLRK